MEFKIERAKLSDADTILRLIKHAHQQNVRNHFRFPITTYNIELFRKKMQRNIFYVMKKDHLIIGTVAIKKRKAYWEIGSLAVLPSYQNKGIGTKLIQMAEMQIRKRGARQFILFTPKHHPNLPKYYRKQGYRESTHFTAWGLTLVRMEKQIKPIPV